MNIHWRHLLFGLTLALTITVFGLVIAYSDGKQGIEGWEKNSGYNLSLIHISEPTRL